MPSRRARRQSEAITHHPADISGLLSRLYICIVCSQHRMVRQGMFADCIRGPAPTEQRPSASVSRNILSNQPSEIRRRETTPHRMVQHSTCLENGGINGCIFCSPQREKRCARDLSHMVFPFVSYAFRVLGEQNDSTVATHTDSSAENEPTKNTNAYLWVSAEARHSGEGLHPLIP